MLLSVRTPNINDLTHSITGAVKVVVGKHMSIRTASRNKQKQLRKPWITNSVLKSIKNKQFMYKTHFLSNDPAEKEEYIKIFQINSTR